LGLGALALVAGLTIVEVHTAEELLTAVGPQRTIRLAPGSYDLRAVTPRELPFVKWDAAGGTPGIAVHDVDMLTIEGPAKGEARFVTGAAFRLRFETMQGLTLRRIGIGPGPNELLPRYRIAREYLESLEFRNVDTLLVEDVRWCRDAVRAFELDGARHAKLRRVDLAGDYPVTLKAVTDLRIEDSRLRPDTRAIFIAAASDIVVANTMIFAPMRPDVTVEEQFSTSSDVTIGLVNVRLIDEASGKLRRTITEPAFRLNSSRTASESFDVPFVIERRGRPNPESAGPAQSVLIRLEDGREPVTDFQSESGYGLDERSVRARRLGSSSGPIAVTWDTQLQGNGAYSTAYYRILGGRPGDGLLLAGAFSASGSTGAGNGGMQERTFALENGLLTVRGSATGIDSHGPPGFPAEQDDEEGTVYTSESRTAFELIYRLDGERLIPLRYEEYERIEPWTNLAAMYAKGMSPSWPHRDGTPPRVGEWLKTIVSLKDGAGKYPMIDLSDPDQP
jgi:hypothetical protein